MSEMVHATLWRHMNISTRTGPRVVHLSLNPTCDPNTKVGINKLLLFNIANKTLLERYKVEFPLGNLEVCVNCGSPHKYEIMLYNSYIYRFNLIKIKHRVCFLLRLIRPFGCFQSGWTLSVSSVLWCLAGSRDRFVERKSLKWLNSSFKLLSNSFF